MSIVEFLKARIDEDEATARGRSNAAPIHYSGCYYYSCSLDSGWFCDCDEDGKATTRLLAERAAKRSIIKQHEDWPVLVETEPDFEQTAITDTSHLTYSMSRKIAWLTEREYVKRFGTEAPTTLMIRSLAAVYSDHPDYQEDWK